MARAITFSRCNISLNTIHKQYSCAESSLRLYYSQDNPQSATLFAGYTKQELADELQTHIEELDKATSLSILASIEASFQIDFHVRANLKMKDDLSRRFRHIHKQVFKSANKKLQGVSLERDILRTWQETYPQYKTTISDYISALKFRHWLAHGRYWVAQIGKKYDYITLYGLSAHLHSNLPFRLADQ